MSDSLQRAIANCRCAKYARRACRRGCSAATAATAGAQQRERCTEQQQSQLCTLSHNLFTSLVMPIYQLQL